ncbi:MAG: polysaccharide biosynthesis C-terminal domain-containing protein [Candidatus Andeanibacterium colombiense]|uniref:Polysaccharide biosynthesis C-terminal domain-containing protein n=1 Tax=Candidatus Andeanibacterium colombiense TaxID=3121345 RepID=A0AAJ5X4K7_9SPHN|nr:MAG: polysaccharide biosynthesis C-terminal domain-containing protein [Sphingomonadaceae bacterium]
MRIFTKNHRVLNFAGLLAGFGLGQGSLFVVQTWLLATDHVTFLGHFSFIFTMVILAYQAIDLGGLVILARRVAADEESSAHDLSTFYWSFSLVRFIIALLLAVAAACWWVGDPMGFSSSYTGAATLGLIVFSLNPGGLLDGYNKSGWSGATWALPFVASAIALPFCPELRPGQAGFILGGALSVGAIFAVVGQYVILHRHGARPLWRRPNSLAMRATGREALLYMIGWLPGQLYFRGQIALAMALLGPVPTALIVYAKQVVMSSTRFLYFARRIEYPNLVKQLADGQRLVYKILTIQRISLYMGVVGMLGLAGFGIALHFAFPGQLKGAGLIIALFAPIVLTASVNATFMQACYAMKRTGDSAWTAILIATAGLALQAILTPFFGMAGIALAEGLCQLGGAGLIVLVLSERIRFAQGSKRAQKAHTD